MEVFRQLKSNNEETFITGFRFYKNFEEVIFTSMNCNDLNMIAKYVQARCFLLNFHDVYKPVMKIGKGTFADVNEYYFKTTKFISRFI